MEMPTSGILSYGPKFMKGSIMGNTPNRLNDKQWLENSEKDIYNKLKFGGENLISKGFKLKDKLNFQRDKIKNNKYDIIEKIKRNNMQELRGSFNMKNINKGSMLMGKPSKLMSTSDKSMMLSMNKKSSNINVKSMLGMNKNRSNINVKDMLGMNKKNNNQILQLTKNKNNIDNLLSINKNKKTDISKMISFNSNKNFISIGKQHGKKLEKNALKNMIRGTENIAINRINMQKKVKSLFGDYDGDKVANILDCNPINKKKQGAVHDFFKSFSSNPDIKTERDIELDKDVRAEYIPEIDDDNYDTDMTKNSRDLDVENEVNIYEPEPLSDLQTFSRDPIVKTQRDLDIEKKIKEQEAEMKIKSIVGRDMEVVGEGFKKLGEGTKKVGGALITGFGNMGKGIQKLREVTPEQREYNIKKLEAKARIEEAKAKVNKSSNIRMPYDKLGKFGEAVRTSQQAIGALPFTQNFSNSVSMLRTSPASSTFNKISYLVGGGSSGSGVGFRKALGLPEPEIQQMPQQEMVRQQYSPQPVIQNNYGGNMMVVKGVQYIKNEDGSWQNTKTGKNVTYPRGGYDKKSSKQNIIYVPVPQPTQQQYQY